MFRSAFMFKSVNIYYGSKLMVSSLKTARGLHSSRFCWVSLKADPQVCLHDVHTTLTVQDLPPLTPVTLRAQVHNDNGKMFCSHGQYMSDSAGHVYVDSAASVGGSYTGVFPAGLLTTLAPAPGEFPYIRLYKKDPAIPWKMTVSAYLGHHAVSLEEPSGAVANVVMTRHLMAPGVTRYPVKEGRVRGVMYLPPPQYGPAVGVVDMFGAVGGIMEFRAAMLASRGYAVLALPFFGYEDLPAVPHTLELEYFEEAVQFVMAQKNVIPDRCGMISVSKSTDIALLLSTKVPELTAVVGIGVVSVSYDTNITYKGQLVAEGIKISVDKMQMDEMGRVFPNPKFINSFSQESLDNSTLHLEEATSDTHYLLAAGSEDSWLCYLCVSHLMDYMSNHNLSYKMEGIIYPGAGHLIEPPYGPLIHHSYQRILPVLKDMLVGDKGAEAGDVELPGGKGDQDAYMTGVPILFGGQSKQTCDAQVDLWGKTQHFFNRRVRDSSPWYQNYLDQSNNALDNK